MSGPNLHVVTHDEGWAVKREKQETPESLHASQNEAIEAACAVAEAEHRSVIIHRRDGRIRSVQTFDEESFEKREVSQIGRPRNPQSRWKKRVGWGAAIAGVVVSMTVAGYLAYRYRDRISQMIPDRHKI